MAAFVLRGPRQNETDILNILNQTYEGERINNHVFLNKTKTFPQMISYMHTITCMLNYCYKIKWIIMSHLDK